MTTAVTGIGSTSIGRLPGCDVDDLAVSAALAALADAGITGRDVDGVIGMRVSSYEAVAARLGIESRWSLQLPAEGRMTGPALQLAASAIDAGRCTTVLIAYGNDSRSGGHRYGAAQGASAAAAAEGYGTAPELTRAVGLTSPGAFYALMAERHRARFGTTDEQLARVSLAFREHARANPAAMLTTPLQLADYLDAPYIARPLRLLDYCVIADGGVALIVTRADRAGDGPQRPVALAGFGQQGALRDSTLPPEDFWHDAIATAGRAALRQAHRDRADVDLLQIYDNFSPNILFALEGLGYCGVGESGPWLEETSIAVDGPVPVNSSGGHLSEGYLQGWGHVVECVRQLRGQADERQVPDVAVAQYVAPAPICSSVVFTRDAA